MFICSLIKELTDLAHTDLRQSPRSPLVRSFTNYYGRVCRVCNLLVLNKVYLLILPLQRDKTNVRKKTISWYGAGKKTHKLRHCALYRPKNVTANINVHSSNTLPAWHYFKNATITNLHILISWR